MHKKILQRLAFIGLVAVGTAQAASATPRYSIVDRFAGADGDYDYVSFDAVHQQVFVGRTTGVMKIDLASRKVTMDFVKGEGVAAVLLIPGTSLMLSTNGDANTAMLFDRTTGAVKATIPTGKGPDGALYDANSKLAFVMNGDSEDVTLIDLARATTVATIPVGGKPEAAASDDKGRVYINIEDTAEIAVVDVAARKVVARYKLAGCHEPTGIDFDRASGLLVSACHNRMAKLVEAATGADKGTLTIAENADGVIIDVQRRLVYIPCKEGILSIFSLTEDGKAGNVQAIRTQEFARTAALDPKSGRLYLPVNRRVKKPSGEPEPVPGSFEVLVVAPK
jgi:YVTN family beta-propeller protein